MVRTTRGSFLALGVVALVSLSGCAGERKSKVPKGADFGSWSGSVFKTTPGYDFKKDSLVIAYWNTLGNGYKLLVDGKPMDSVKISARDLQLSIVDAAGNPVTLTVYTQEAVFAHHQVIESRFASGKDTLDRQKFGITIVLEDELGPYLQ